MHQNNIITLPWKLLLHFLNVEHSNCFERNTSIYLVCLLTQRQHIEVLYSYIIKSQHEKLYIIIKIFEVIF